MKSLTLLFPAVWFMRRLRLNVKLGLMSAMLLLPLMWVGAVLVQDRTNQLDFTRSELHGTQLILQLIQASDLVQQHRGRTAMLLAGNAAAQESLNGLRSELKTVSRAVLALSETRADFGLSKEWATLVQRIDTLQDTSRLSAPDSFKLHTVLVADLHRFTYTVAERSQLLFEPEAGPYFLMDMVVSRVPPGAELVAQLRGLGAAQLSQGQVQAEAAGAIQLKALALEVLLADLRFSMTFVDKHVPVDPSGAASLQAITDFLQVVRSAFAQPGSVSAESYFSAGTAALEAIKRYQVKETGVLESLLRKRVDSLELEWLLDVGGIIAGILLLIYCMSGFYVGFMSDLRQIMKAMREAANGSLKSVMNRRGADELAELTGLLQVLITNTSAMVANIRSNSALVAHAGKRLAEGNQELADRTEQQAASLEQTAASVHQLTSTVAQNAQTAGESDTQAAQVRDVAENGARAMDKAVITVEGIQRHAQKMNEIIDVIDKLAFQTNILALNAAVEAARAGEQGRGFAVVASEVRSLAQRSAASAREIRELILTSRTQVEQGTTQIREAGQSIAQIVHGVRGVASNMSLISASSAEQSSGLSEISSAVMQLDSITQSNADMVERAVAQAVLLEKRAAKLSLAVASFQLQQGSADEARELVKRAETLFSSAGREGFLKRITDPAEGFHDRDMYVFVLDAAGTYRAFGGKPEKVGTRVQDIAGVDGTELLRSIVSQAETGSGWVQYDIVNPLSGQVQEKMSYVCKVGEMYLGCGVYVSVEVEQAA